MGSRSQASAARRRSMRLAWGATFLAVPTWAAMAAAAPPARATCVEGSVGVTAPGGTRTQVTPWAPGACLVPTPFPTSDHVYGSDTDGTGAGYDYSFYIPAAVLF
jgi:hypothetical protein